MEKKVRFGIVGFGAQGSFYAGCLSNKGAFLPGMPAVACPPHCTIGAICDNDPVKEAAAREKYPEVPFYRDWKELALSNDVDVVVTTVPHYLHHEIAIFCMEHGVNVLVEKPAGVRAKDVIAMNRCAEAHPDVVFGIMFNQRTNKLYQKVRELVASGELGEIRRSNWIINTWWRPDSYYKQSAWRATWGGEGGGVLVNQAPHQLDLWQWICGSPIRVTSKNINGAYRDIATENDVTILTEYANGATGCFITCTHDAIGTDRFEIDLSAGKIVIENSAKATIYRMKRSEPELNATMTIRDVELLTKGNASGDRLYDTEVIENVDAWGVQHTAVLENYALAVLTGSPLLAPGTDGIMGVNLANASQLSAWTGKTVDFPVDSEVYAAALNEHIAAEGKYPTRD